jgi:hypothetical protein
MGERHTVQVSSLRRDLQAAAIRAEITESELCANNEEIKELRDSKLLFKKKVGPVPATATRFLMVRIVSRPQTETFAELEDFK